MQHTASTSTRARRTGAVVLDDDTVQWRVWAPNVERLDLVLVDHPRGTLQMHRDEEGYFTHTESGVADGQSYWYRLNGNNRPDPCSLWQPDGVEGPSAVVRPERIVWSDDGWRGVRRQDLVI